MGEFSRKIVEEYRTPREQGDYAVQAGILSALLKAVMEGSESGRDTAAAVLQIHAKK